MNLADLVRIIFAWWVVGICFATLFMLTLRRDEAPQVYDLMRAHRWATVRFVMKEAWVWPLCAIGLLGLFVKRGMK